MEGPYGSQKEALIPIDCLNGSGDFSEFPLSDIDNMIMIHLNVGRVLQSSL